MAGARIPETDLARIRRFCEERIPAHLRDQIRLEVETRGRSVTIVECRPYWLDPTAEWTRMKVAQFRYDEAEKTWTCTGETETSAGTSTGTWSPPGTSRCSWQRWGATRPEEELLVPGLLEGQLGQGGVLGGKIQERPDPFSQLLPVPGLLSLSIPGALATQTGPLLGGGFSFGQDLLENLPRGPQPQASAVPAAPFP